MEKSEDVLLHFNFDIHNIITLVNVWNLKQLLQQSQYNKSKTEKLIEGFTNGFKLAYQGSQKIARKAPNLKLSAGTHIDLWNKVMGEVEKGWFAGPFLEPPYEHFIQLPIGLVPKDQGKDVKLIFHLSYPQNRDSVNSQTPKDICAVKYPDFSEAIQMCIDISKVGKQKFVY